MWLADVTCNLIGSATQLKAWCLFEVVEPGHQKELLQEEFRVEHRDVSRTSDQRVGRVR